MSDYFRGVIKAGSLSGDGLFQSRDQTTQVDLITAEDEGGNAAAFAQINPTRRANLEFVPISSATVITSLRTQLEAAGNV
jgi:hypothetical protein